MRIPPAIFLDVTKEMRIAREEVFGPARAVLRFEAVEDAVKIADGLRSGLAAGVWTRRLKRAVTMADRLKAGTAWIHGYRPTRLDRPFAGFKESGIGGEGGSGSIFANGRVWHLQVAGDPHALDLQISLHGLHAARNAAASIAMQRAWSSTGG
ncbi:aldehyde dehydrogenase family protein [Propylenella binzhouense]|uniref:Aldehyde dehydrogenase family protein n=1 Tax=Propylenella binzhouense TaxID=2555902 RepID=A0A964WS67_9HYPH|nr:aldehyde dehydrogenase family protein [Propylenella binzhouense]MYZ46551.1 aldehyde dehydrogenase family protein [Propylenella binzhouense]